MKTSFDLIKSMGKRKFVEFASRQPAGDRMLDVERKRGRGKGRILSLYCKHGFQIVKNFEFQAACPKCCRETKVSKTRDFEPHFNMGLGCYFETRSEMLSEAKRQGQTWIGDDRL